MRDPTNADAEFHPARGFESAVAVSQFALAW
jgi:hypothetical protein